MSLSVSTPAFIAPITNVAFLGAANHHRSQSLLPRCTPKHGASTFASYPTAQTSFSALNQATRSSRSLLRMISIPATPDQSSNDQQPRVVEPLSYLPTTKQLTNLLHTVDAESETSALEKWINAGIRQGWLDQALPTEEFQQHFQKNLGQLTRFLTGFNEIQLDLRYPNDQREKTELTYSPPNIRLNALVMAVMAQSLVESCAGSHEQGVYAFVELLKNFLGQDAFLDKVKNDPNFKAEHWLPDSDIDLDDSLARMLIVIASAELALQNPQEKLQYYGPIQQGNMIAAYLKINNRVEHDLTTKLTYSTETSSEASLNPLERVRQTLCSKHEVFPTAGPSSSHCVAPGRVGYQLFNEIQSLSEEELDQIEHIEIDAHDSLAMTGEPHGLRQGMLCGLNGISVDQFDSLKLIHYFNDWYNNGMTLALPNGKRVPLHFNWKETGPLPLPDVKGFDSVPNGINAKLIGANQEILTAVKAYSTGGGRIQDQAHLVLHCQHGPEQPTEPAWEFGSAAELVESMRSHEKRDINRFVEAYEDKVGKTNPQELAEHYTELTNTAVDLFSTAANSPIEVVQLEPLLLQAAILSSSDSDMRSPFQSPGRILSHLARTSAAGGINLACTVAIPECAAAMKDQKRSILGATLGSSGVPVAHLIPVIAEHAGSDLRKLSSDELATVTELTKNVTHDFWSAYCLAVMLTKRTTTHAASIAGCQAEVGNSTVAGAMGTFYAHAKHDPKLAALMHQLTDNKPWLAEAYGMFLVGTYVSNHYLGQTCTPLGGFVGDPCERRNILSYEVSKAALTKVIDHLEAQADRGEIINDDLLLKAATQFDKVCRTQWFVGLAMDEALLETDIHQPLKGTGPAKDQQAHFN